MAENQPNCLMVTAQTPAASQLPLCFAPSLSLSLSLSLDVYICGNLFHAIQQMLFNYLGIHRRIQYPLCLFSLYLLCDLCLSFLSCLLSLSYFAAAANWLTEPLSGCCHMALQHLLPACDI